jgi:predicted nuclease of predicted toxin-antitoxin system
MNARTIRVKLDEDLPRLAVQVLREAGYSAASVPEQEITGRTDAELWQAVAAEHRFLVTADKGFADVRRYPPGSHAGILLLRPDTDGASPVVALLEMVLAPYGLE